MSRDNGLILLLYCISILRKLQTICNIDGSVYHQNTSNIIYNIALQLKKPLFRKPHPGAFDKPALVHPIQGRSLLLQLFSQTNHNLTDRRCLYAVFSANNKERPAIHIDWQGLPGSKSTLMEKSVMSRDNGLILLLYCISILRKLQTICNIEGSVYHQKTGNIIYNVALRLKNPVFRKPNPGAFDKPALVHNPTFRDAPYYCNLLRQRSRI